MNEPDTAPPIRPEQPIIPIGLHPHDVAREFAAAMAAIAGYRVPVIPVISFELNWPLVLGVRTDRRRPLVLAEPGLLVIVSLFANIGARLMDRRQPDRCDAALRDLMTMRFDTLPHEVVLTEPECRFARAMGQGVLRFLIGDACLSAWAGRDKDLERVVTLPDGRTARPLRSLWMKNAPGWRPLAAFVENEAGRDLFAPLPSVARAGVTLFLLTIAMWELDTWCLSTIEAWRAALTGDDGEDRSGYEWALRVSDDINAH